MTLIVGTVKDNAPAQRQRLDNGVSSGIAAEIAELDREGVIGVVTFDVNAVDGETDLVLVGNRYPVACLDLAAARAMRASAAVRRRLRCNPTQATTRSQQFPIAFAGCMEGRRARSLGNAAHAATAPRRCRTTRSMRRRKFLRPIGALSPQVCGHVLFAQVSSVLRAPSIRRGESTSRQTYFARRRRRQRRSKGADATSQKPCPLDARRRHLPGSAYRPYEHQLLYS
eukprot:4815659-Pleurochrysis_carterae.AAC.2